ncbi:MAG: hypothetical protein SXA11_23370 [Cyanobacteriota bacterium]|nr:hypothetical protein [Cyanobacteriota bacterium]
MTLLFPNGDNFATGAIRYDYRPVTATETTNRIILPVLIENIPTEAVVDTGAPYVICPPRIARLAGIQDIQPLERSKMLIRGMRLDGSIIRLSIKIVALEGENLTVDATAFLPDVEEYWGDFPSFLGLTGFLERIRFAVDPNTDTFYFGQLV